MRKLKNMKLAISVVLLLGCFTGFTSAQEKQQFQTPEEAVSSFRTALKADGNTPLLRLFGDETRALLDNADEAGIQESRRLLNLLFEERWDLVETEDGNRLLRLGLEGWPFPVPIVASGSTWRFDTKAGLDEIANRRVGRDELAAIETCLRVLDAQEDFRLSDPNNDGVREYSSLFRSSEGQKDGLYWAAEVGDPISPLQEALQDSWKYAEDRTAGAPWFGYRFKFLEGQGENAPGGAYSYVINGYQIGGFALVAYPANYGHSGVMTFLVNQNGTVFQQDLGPETESIAQGMTLFDPDNKWEEVAEDID
jgi:DUF2950 family protein